MTLFFAELPPLPKVEALCDLSKHSAIPDDSLIVIVDIAGSTKAIQQGRYKDVNLISGSAITAMLNALGRKQVPYIFGGDGITAIISKGDALKVAQALHGTRDMARASFDIDLRAGFVPIKGLIAQGAPVRLAKFEAAPNVFQTVFSGSGVTLAEKLVKAPETAKKYDISALFNTEELTAVPANFEGLECRWQPLKSRNGQDVSIIIQARGNEQHVYKRVLDNIIRICGEPSSWQPAHESTLDVSCNPIKLLGETKVRTPHSDFAARFKYLLRLMALTITGKVCFALGLKAGSFDGKSYKRDTADHSDYIKFDNALRLLAFDF